MERGLYRFYILSISDCYFTFSSMLLRLNYTIQNMPYILQLPGKGVSPQNQIHTARYLCILCAVHWTFPQLTLQAAF